MVYFGSIYSKYLYQVIYAVIMLNLCRFIAHWGLSNPSPGVFDWEGFRSLSLFLDIAQEVGLWVIVRPGRKHCRSFI